MKTTSEEHTPTQRVLMDLVRSVVELSETTRRLASEDADGQGLLRQLREDLEAASGFVSILEGSEEDEVALEVEARVAVDRPAEIVESLDDLFGED